MAAPASLLGHGPDAIHRPGNRATDEEQIALGVDAHDPQAQLGVAPRAHVARHALALDHPRRVGTRTDRAGLAVPRVTMRGGTAPGVVAVDHALETAALGAAGDLHQLARG